MLWVLARASTDLRMEKFWWFCSEEQVENPQISPTNNAISMGRESVIDGIDLCCSFARDDDNIKEENRPKY